jgi:DNA-binding Lrp family transcriptional regulator
MRQLTGEAIELGCKDIVLDAGKLQVCGMRLDERDEKLVTALAGDAWLSYGELGRLVNLSASAVQRRVEKLISAGIIQGARARIAPDALGKPVRLYVLVELMEETKSAINAFTKRLSACRDVEEAHYVAGVFDVIVVIQAASMAGFADFAENHLNANPLVRRYKTLTSLRPLI